MTPRYVVEATISKGATIEARLVSEVAYHCNLTLEWAKTAVANAIVELERDGVIVMFKPGAYRLADKAKFEPKREPKVKTLKPETGMERLIREAQAREEACE